MDAELDRIISDYKSSGYGVKPIVKYIKWSGISDTRFFDLVESDLKIASLHERDGKKVGDMAWKLYALAYSGNSKYRSSIERFLNSDTGKLKRHAEKSFDLLPQFTKWNPIISASLEALSADQLDYQRILNKLNSGEFHLIRSAAGDIFNTHPSDSRLHTEVSKVLKEKHTDVILESPDSDAVAWLCKILGSSGDAKYLPLLEEVRDNARMPAVKKWSKKSIEKIREE